MILELDCGNSLIKWRVLNAESCAGLAGGVVDSDEALLQALNAGRPGQAALDVFDVIVIEWGAVVLVWEELGSSAMHYGVVGMGCMLQFMQFGMIVLEEDIIDIALHGQASHALVVIPGYVDVSKF